ncbi:MAG: hypothetical protein QNL17_09315, partial [Synechococcus sp. ChSW.bin.154]
PLGHTHRLGNDSGCAAGVGKQTPDRLLTLLPIANPTLSPHGRDHLSAQICEEMELAEIGKSRVKSLLLFTCC